MVESFINARVFGYILCAWYHSSIVARDVSNAYCSTELPLDVTLTHMARLVLTSSSYRALKVKHTYMGSL